MPLASALMMAVVHADDGTSSISDEAWADAEAKAQQIYDEWLAGDATEDTFAALAEEHTQDPGSMTTGGLYEEVFPGQMVTEFNDWCFADGRQVGDVVVMNVTDETAAKFVLSEANAGYMLKREGNNLIYAENPVIPTYTVTFKNWDGTVLKTQAVAPGAAATAPQEPNRAGDKDYEYDFDKWDTDFSKVNSDLVVTATFKSKDHTGISKTYQSGATCTKAATYTQLCTECGFVWTEVFEDPAMPALGHTYERENPSSTVVTGTSTGKADLKYLEYLFLLFLELYQ